MHHPTNARATSLTLAQPATRGARRLRAALLSGALVASALAWPLSTAAADNVPPVAVDDPGITCMPTGAYGGAFPMPEDWGRFDFAGVCSAISNDTDADGTIASWQIVSQPAHGTLEWLPNFPGIFGYRAQPDFSTPVGDWVSDSFTYRVIDNLGAVSNVATVRMWVAPINDPPRFLSVPFVEVEENSGPYDASWLPYVSAGPSNESTQRIEFIIWGGVFNGVAFTEPPTFTPDGRLTFTPAPNTHGDARITVYLKDDGGLEDHGLMPRVRPADTSNFVTFTIFVNEANATPAAVNDSATVDEDSGKNRIEVLANDSDADAETIWVTGTSQGAKGSVAIIGDGPAVTYTPNADVTGTDAFTYTIRDWAGATATATVYVTITPVNDLPTATDDGSPTPIAILKGSGPVQIAVLANDTTTPDAGEALQITAVTQGAIGAVAIGSDGLSLTYDPERQTTGLDVFTYTISDGNGGFDTATVHISVTKTTKPR